MVRFGIAHAWLLSLIWLLATVIDVGASNSWELIHTIMLVTQLPITICFYKPMLEMTV